MSLLVETLTQSIIVMLGMNIKLFVDLYQHVYGLIVFFSSKQVV